MADVLEEWTYDAVRVWRAVRSPQRSRRLLASRRESVGGYSVQGSERCGCLFIHVPKCAGKSIVAALFGGIEPGHLTDADYRQIYRYAEYCGLFRFTFVRNPWDRLVSAYSYLSQGGTTKSDQRFRDTVLSRYDGVNEFVEEWLTEQSAMTCTHFKPQSHFLPKPRQRPQLDFVGRFESLREDFRHVCDRIGAEAELPRSNTSRRKADWRRLLSPPSVERVAEIYREDIARFGYSPDFNGSSV